MIRSEVGLIDVDTAIHITLLTAYFPDSSTLSWAAAAGAPDGFVEYLTDCQRYILERMKTRRLLSLVVFAGIPGSFSLSFPDPLKGCVTTALPIYDLATLEDSRDRLLEFLHSVEHSVDLSNAGVNVMNWAGPMNFHAYRKHTGTALFPMGDSSALHRMMMLEPTFLAEWRQEIRIATDRRLLHHPLLDKAIEVVRWGSRSPRPSERQRAIYRSVPLPPMTGQTGVDCFVCEGVNGFLWFVKGVDQKLDSTIEQALQHVLKMAIQWLGVAWCHAEDHGLRCQLELCLRFDESIHEDWIASLNVDTMQLDIRFSLAGLNAFHSPTNEPERNFIRCIVGVLCKYLPHGLGDDLQAHIDNAQADPNARHFHRVISRDAATWVQNDVAGACYWPSAETRQLYRWRVLVRDLGLGAFQCSETNQREALDGLVEGLWKEIEEELSELNLSHFVRACLRSITKARADLIQLDLTTGALLAVHPAKDQEQSRIHSWREGLNAAPPALRTLVEIAAYSCPRGSGEEKIGDDRLMALMVRACLLIETSQIRFGVFQGFIAPDVSFNEEGELIYDAGELGLLMKRYSEQTNQEWDLGNVASYGRQIGTLSPPADEEVVQAGSEFDVAFVAEFGVSVPKLGECITRLENYAVRGSVCSVLYLTTTELAAILDHLDEPALKGFIESFSLPLRSGRYEDLAELKEREVHPWLHRRQLSLIARPMVPDGVGPDARFLIPVGLLRQGIDLRIGQWRRGEMGAQSARLDKMKTWVGAAKDDWGKRFEKAVIDRLEAKGFRCLGGKMMPFYGAPGNPNLGDLDVLAWHSDKPDILVVECKNLLLARNLAEVIDELREFSEHPPNGAINALTKHIRRFNWIRDNWAQASKAEGMPNRDSPRLRSVLLFNASGPVGLNLSNTVVEVFYSRQFIDAFC